MNIEIFVWFSSYLSYDVSYLYFRIFKRKFYSTNGVIMSHPCVKSCVALDWVAFGKLCK